MSTNLAASIAVAAHAQGLSRVDHVVLSDDAKRAYAVQGELNSPFKQIAEVDVNQSVGKTMAQSSAEWQQAPTQTQQPVHTQTQQQQQQQQPEMHR